jgi:ribosomal protein S6--L-glutamate ligase
MNTRTYTTMNTRPSTRMRVAIVALRHPSGRFSVLVPEMEERLADLGCEVDVIDPDAGPVDLGAVRPDADLYILKSGTEAALSFAGVLHARGARVVNPYPVAAVCRDKVVQTHVLAEAGVPVPESWMTVDPMSLLPRLEDGPLILKDPRGSQGRGLEIVHDRDGLAALPGGTPWLAMRYHRPEGEDLKLYRIGDEVFGVERIFPATTYAQKLGRPYAVSDDLRDIVLRCGDAFGISVYGVDVIRSRGRLWVVDMSSFPGFKGVPAAGRRIVDHVVTAGNRTEARELAS